MFPYTSEELLNELDERFPEKSPTLDETYETLIWRGGQRSVIQFLRQQFEDQSKRQLTGE